MTGQVCVLGSFMADLIAYAPRRPEPGETLVGHSFRMFLGGKGFNQATAAARLGAHTSFIGQVGADEFGLQFRDALVAEGIDAAGVTTSDSLGTGVGLPVVDDDGQNSIIIVPQANLAMGVEQVERARGVIEAADVLLIQLELPTEVAVAGARIAKAAGTTVILNPAPFRVMPEELTALADVLVPNEVEARELLGRACPANANELAGALHAAYGCAVVTTLGSWGAVAVDADGTVTTVLSHKVDAIDTVGAGDTFCGALGAELALGMSLPDAVHTANIAAAIGVTRNGGASAAPTRAEVEGFATMPVTA